MTTQCGVCSFRPYNPGETIGRVDPTLPPVPQPPQQDDGCGVVGQIVMVAIAAAVVYMTAAAATGAVASLFGTTGAAAGSFAAVATSAGGYALAGAAGSIVSQGVGMAMGMQNSINWRAVGQAALSSAIGGGLSASGVVPAGLPNFVSGAAIGAMSSGINMALHGTWSWSQLAGSAIGGAIGSEFGASTDPAVPSDPLRGMQDLAGRFVGNWVGSRISTGRAQAASAWVNTIGNALGSALADEISPPDRLGQFIDRQLRAQERRDVYGLVGAGNASGNAIVGLPSRPSPQAQTLGAPRRDGSVPGPTDWGYRNGGDVDSDQFVPGGQLLSSENLELARILKFRDVPFAVGPDGTLHHYNPDKSTGVPIALTGSRIDTNVRADGVTVSQHVFINTDGTTKILGTDYGVNPEYVANQPADVGGDPVFALRRQVAVSRVHSSWASQYIDAGSAQVDPARWGEFLQDAQQQGLKMTVTSNGIDNAYLQGMDNAIAIAGGYKDSLTVNVYNPTKSFFADLKEAAMSVLFNERQSSQVAIQNQVVEALKYNAEMIAAQKELGITIEPFKTHVIGHSQGTINVNRAVADMSDGDQLKLRTFDIGRYYPWESSRNIGHNIVINDMHDGSRFASAWASNEPTYQNMDNRQYRWTDFNNDGEGDIGNNHSLYLYLQRIKVQDALGMNQPQILTKPFVSTSKPAPSAPVSYPIYWSN